MKKFVVFVLIILFASSLALANGSGETSDDSEVKKLQSIEEDWAKIAKEYPVIYGDISTLFELVDFEVIVVHEYGGDLCERWARGEIELPRELAVEICKPRFGCFEQWRACRNSGKHPAICLYELNRCMKPDL